MVLVRIVSVFGTFSVFPFGGILPFRVRVWFRRLLVRLRLLVPEGLTIYLLE